MSDVLSLAHCTYIAEKPFCKTQENVCFATADTGKIKIVGNGCVPDLGAKIRPFFSSDLDQEKRIAKHRLC